MDWSLPVSSVHGILQERIVEWMAIPFSRGSLLNQGLLHCRQTVYCLRHQRKCVLLWYDTILYINYFLQFSSVQFSHSVVSNSLRPHELQHARLSITCPSPVHGPVHVPVHHQLPEFTQTFVHRVGDAIQPSYPLSSPSPAPQSPPASESFPLSQLFTWGGQSTGVSALASVLPKKSQDWSPLEWTGWISLQSKGLLRVFSNTTVQKHQFFSAQPSSQSNSHIHRWPLEKP